MPTPDGTIPNFGMGGAEFGPPDELLADFYGKVAEFNTRVASTYTAVAKADARAQAVLSGLQALETAVGLVITTLQKRQASGGGAPAIPPEKQNQIGGLLNGLLSGGQVNLGMAQQLLGLLG